MLQNEFGHTKNAIITPTFKGHFGQIKKFIESAKQFVLDKDVHFYFIVEAADHEELVSIVRSASGQLCTTVVSFEECLSAFQVDTSPRELLARYDKFTYQTLKKFYGMLHINAERYLVLDSESMFIRPTSLSKMFDEYFDSPFLVVSHLTSRADVPPLSMSATLNGAAIVQADPDIWALETFHWFYSTPILWELVNEHGMPITWAVRMHKTRGSDQHIFEIVVYYIYLAKHSARLNYRILYVEDLLEKYLSPADKIIYEQQLSSTPPWRDGGLLEHFILFLTAQNTDGFLKLCNEMPVSILRCDTSAGRVVSQAEFLSAATGVRILAASQDHAFGVNNTIWRFVEGNRLTFIERMKQAKSNFRSWPGVAVSGLALLRNVARYSRIKSKVDKVAQTGSEG